MQSKGNTYCQLLFYYKSHEKIKFIVPVAFLFFSYKL